MIDIPNQFIPTTFSWLNQEKKTKKYKKVQSLAHKLAPDFTKASAIRKSFSFTAWCRG